MEHTQVQVYLLFALLINKLIITLLKKKKLSHFILCRCIFILHVNHIFLRMCKIILYMHQMMCKIIVCIQITPFVSIYKHTFN